MPSYSATATTEIDVGTVLGDTYEVTQLLGQGGMGAVYAARHLRLPGRRVAIKVLLGTAARDREAFARFRREAEIASRIGHPNIVEVLDFNVLASGTPYLVLEFLDGEDLSVRLRRGPLPLDQTLAIARQIGSALFAAHRHDVVHRDLKPGNVFLVPSELGGELGERAKVLDFGVSKIRGSQTVQTQDSVLLGTPQYMAPEQALGRNAQIDARADVFALGAMVYEMLTGTAPFEGDNLAQVIFKVVYETPPPLATLLPSLPPTVTAAVERALAKEPNDRFADMAGFIAALTGRPLQTLNRAAVGTPSDAFAATAASTPSPLAGSGAAVGAGSSLGATRPAGPPSTHARGEMAPTAARPASGGRLGIGLAVAGLVALVGGAAVVWNARHPTGVPPTALTGGNVDPTTKPVAVPVANPPVNPPTKPVAVPVANPPVNPPTKPVAVPVANPPVDPPTKPTVEPPSKPDDGPAKPDPGKAAHGGDVKPGHGKHADAPLPPAVAADLNAAEAALGNGRADEAIHLARRTLITARSSRAFSIIARGYCHGGDLGNAKAALHSVAAAERGSVLRYCKAHGTDLQ